MAIEDTAVGIMGPEMRTKFMGNFKNVTAIVLAAGKGTRMQSNLPKVLHTIEGKPILFHTLKTLERVSFGQILVVVGYKANDVKKAIGNKWQYVKQKEQHGTAHAVETALPYLSPECDTVVVFNGDDSMFYSVETLDKLIQNHLDSDKKLSILTTVLEDVAISGRVVRDKDGKFLGFKANSEFTPEELRLHNEIICGLYIFERKWLLANLPKVEISTSKEYNITRLIFLALSKDNLQDIQLENSDEWRSINTQEELERARKLWKKKNDRNS